MKKTFVLTALLFGLLCPDIAIADQKPINLNRVKPVRTDKCLIKVVAYLNGKPHAFSRLQGMEYTRADGKHMTVKDKQHPWNNCDLIDLGEVTSFSTGLMKSGLNIQVALLDEGLKKKYVSTYADRREPILEKLQVQDYERMPDYTNMIRWNSSVMYILPASAKTENEEPVAIYCKLPAGVKNDPSVPREQRRKLCSTRYITPEGIGFGYTYLESEREYKPTEVDRSAREYFAKTPVKKLTETQTAP